MSSSLFLYAVAPLAVSLAQADLDLLQNSLWAIQRDPELARMRLGSEYSLETRTFAKERYREPRRQVRPSRLTWSREESFHQQREVIAPHRIQRLIFRRPSFRQNVRQRTHFNTLLLE